MCCSPEKQSTQDLLAPDVVPKRTRPLSSSLALGDREWGSDLRGVPRVPLRLPTPPSSIPSVSLDDLFLDPELESVPKAFLVDKLSSLGPHLLNLARNTRVHVEHDTPLPEYARCTIAPHLFEEGVIPPTHILSVASIDEPNRQLLLPAHGILWATQCAALDFLSCAPELRPPHRLLPQCEPPSSSQEARDLFVPVVRLQLPSAHALPILQSWCHLRSQEDLLFSLLPPPTSSSNVPARFSAIGSISRELSHLPLYVLLGSLRLIQGLWHDAVALQVKDCQVWETMNEAWDLVVTALLESEKQN